MSSMYPTTCVMRINLKSRKPQPKNPNPRKYAHLLNLNPINNLVNMRTLKYTVAPLTVLGHIIHLCINCHHLASTEISRYTQGSKTSKHPGIFSTQTTLQKNQKQPKILIQLVSKKNFAFKIHKKHSISSLLSLLSRLSLLSLLPLLFPRHSR